MLPLRAPYWQQLFGIDLRSLALFRIAIALTCILEMAHIWTDSSAFFAVDGLYPRDEAIQWSDPSSWSLYYLSGHVLWARFLLCLTMLSSLALLVGYRTRVAAFLCWILIFSYSTRIVALGSGAHMLLVGLLFWAMFLPLNAKFSIDSALNTIKVKSNHYLSAATFALLIQMMCLYLFSGLLKSDPVWNTTGDAIYYVLNTTSIPTALGVYLGQWPALTHYLTLYVYYLEIIAAVLLFFPYKNELSRLIILPFLIALHVSFIFFLAIGTFPFVCLRGLVVFIPSLAWDKFLAWFNHRPIRSKIVLYYDQPCEFCRKVCLIFKELGLPAHTPVLAAQEHEPAAQIFQRERSWIVQDGDGNYRTHWDAVAWCWRRSPLLWPLGVLFLPRFMQTVGNGLYQVISHYRGQCAKITGRYFPYTAISLDFKPLFFTQGLLGLLAILLLVSHINTLPDLDISKERISNILSRVGLSQDMGFFAPSPLRVTRWVVIEGVLSDGSVVDLLRKEDNPPPVDKPANGYDAYPNHYWFKLFDRIAYNVGWANLIGHHYCTSEAENKLASMKLSVYEQETVLPGAPSLPIVPGAVLAYECE